jgi:hypothetical protein
MPPGIRVLGTKEPDQKRLSFGSYDYSYMVTYECQPPGRYVVVTYFCQVEPGCRGGAVEVRPGFLNDVQTFLGFTTCDDFIEIAATGGSATIRAE